MKKYITFFTLLLSLSFNQTGIVTPEGENAMGVWGNISKSVDCGDYDCEETFGAGMSYMLENGLELGVSYSNQGINDIDFEMTLFYLQYHIKKIHMLPDANPNIAISLGRLTNTISDNSGNSGDADFTTLTCTLYSNNLFHFNYGYTNQDNSKAEGESISFGKIWNFDSFYLNATYALAIENGKFSDLINNDLDDGIVSIGVGLTF